MPFVTDLITEPDKVSGNKSVLVDKLVYKPVGWKGAIIVVPSGFVTDFASVPPPFRLLIPKMGRHRAAAALHDLLYKKDSNYRHLSREACDGIFLDAMKESGVSAWKRQAMFAGVKMFGWSFFHKKRMEFRL